MKEARKSAAAAILDGNILVVGGENKTGVLATAEMYSLTKKRWNPVNGYPTGLNFYTL